MALQATRAKAQVAAESFARSKSVGSAASDPVALDLAPLIAPHKKQGRVAIRVERMPQTARLSQGRNNGAGSWSLAQDELDDLAYLPPQGATGRSTLAVRIIGSEGATLAVHDFHVDVGAGSVRVEAAPPKNARNQHNAEQTRALERERDALKARLAAREAETADAISRAALASDELEQLRSKPDAQDVLAQAQKEWSASAQSRLEAVEAQWEKRFSDAQARAERERNAAERTRSNADTNELRILRDALKNAHDEIAARDVALTNAKDAQEKELARVERERDDARAAAETEWRAQDTARMAVARQEWEKNADASRATLTEKCERLAAELAAAKEQAPPETTGGDAQKVADLQAELAASKSKNADLHAKADAERTIWRRQSDEQLAKARKEWTEVEVSRLASAQAQWQEESEQTLATAVARYRNAEESLAHSRSEVPQVSQDDEVSQLREECTALQITLANREGELERLRLTTGTQVPVASKSSMALHADSQWRPIEQEELERKISPILVAQIVGVVLVAAMIVFSLPYLESSLPYDWQYEIDSTLLNIESTIGMQTPPRVTPTLPVHQANAAQPALVNVTHSTKLHAKPAKTSAALASLRRGTRAAVLETRNGWTHVRVIGNEKLDGWLPSAFLSGGAAKGSSRHGR